MSVSPDDPEFLKRADPADRDQALKALDRLQSLDGTWRSTIWRQVKVTVTLTLGSFGMLQMFGNWAAWVAVPGQVAGQRPPASPRAGLSPSDMQGLVTQCLAVLAALTIAVVASPIVGRVRNSSTDDQDVTFDAIVQHRWSVALSWISAGVASVANAVALSAALNVDWSCTACSPGMTPLLLILAGAGTGLAVTAMRPSTDPLVANALLDAELRRTQERIARLDTVAPRLGERRSLIWRLVLVAGCLLSLAVAPLLSVLIVYWVYKPEEPLWHAITTSWFPILYIQFASSLVALLPTLGIAYWRWRLVSAGASKKAISAARWWLLLTPTVVTVDLIVSFLLSPQDPSEANPSVMRIAVIAVIGMPALLCTIWGLLWDTPIGHSHRQELKEWQRTLRGRRVAEPQLAGDMTATRLATD